MFGKKRTYLELTDSTASHQRVIRLPLVVGMYSSPLCKRQINTLFGKNKRSYLELPDDTGHTMRSYEVDDCDASIRFGRIDGTTESHDENHQEDTARKSATKKGYEEAVMMREKQVIRKYNSRRTDRVHIEWEGYEATWNVSKNVRGGKFVVDELRKATNGAFYRAFGSRAKEKDRVCFVIN